MHNLDDVIFTMRTGKFRPDAKLEDIMFGNKLYDRNSGVITTATGNPVSIITNKAQNAISTILSYSPKQSGTGDPSPQNIRPIEGWTEANLFGCGKNLFDTEHALLYTNRQFDSDGTITSNSNYNIYRVYLKESYYRISFVITVTTAFRCYAYNANNEQIANIRSSDITGSTSRQSLLLNVPQNTKYILFSASKTISDAQVELGTTATAYEPYTQGANLTANLGGTYYGFSIDLERGVLRVTHTAEVFDENDSWAVSSDRFRANHVPVNAYKQGGVQSTNYIVLAVNWLNYRYVRGSSSLADNEVVWFSSTNNLFIRADAYTTLADFQTFIAENPLVLIAELATPIELPLTPQTVALLKGNNTLWCDGDEVSMTYKAKKQGG